MAYHEITKSNQVYWCVAHHFIKLFSCYFIWRLFFSLHMWQIFSYTQRCIWIFTDGKDSMSWLRKKKSSLKFLYANALNARPKPASDMLHRSLWKALSRVQHAFAATGHDGMMYEGTYLPLPTLTASNLLGRYQGIAVSISSSLISMTFHHYFTTRVLPDTVIEDHLLHNTVYCNNYDKWDRKGKQHTQYEGMLMDVYYIYMYKNHQHQFDSSPKRQPNPKEEAEIQQQARSRENKTRQSNLPKTLEDTRKGSNTQWQTSTDWRKTRA